MYHSFFQLPSKDLPIPSTANYPQTVTFYSRVSTNFTSSDKQQLLRNGKVLPNQSYSMKLHETCLKQTIGLFPLMPKLKNEYPFNSTQLSDYCLCSGRTLNPSLTSKVFRKIWTPSRVYNTILKTRVFPWLPPEKWCKSWFDGESSPRHGQGRSKGEPEDYDSDSNTIWIHMAWYHHEQRVHLHDTVQCTMIHTVSKAVYRYTSLAFMKHSRLHWWSGCCVLKLYVIWGVMKNEALRVILVPRVCKKHVTLVFGVCKAKFRHFVPGRPCLMHGAGLKLP